MTTWPDPARPGVPLNPARDGWHWVRRIDCASPHIQRWSGGMWWTDPSFGGPKIDMARYEYLGPCLTPEEAQVKAARIEELKARAGTWAGIAGTLIAERDQLIGVLQIAIERSGDLEPTPSWVDGACAILNRGFLKVDRAALTGGKDE